jgi:hypothetical protein
MVKMDFFRDCQEHTSSINTSLTDERSMSPPWTQDAIGHSFRFWV